MITADVAEQIASGAVKLVAVAESLAVKARMSGPKVVGRIAPTTDDFLNLASKQRTQQILFGDAIGGGHLWLVLQVKRRFLQPGTRAKL